MWESNTMKRARIEALEEQQNQVRTQIRNNMIKMELKRGDLK